MPKEASQPSDSAIRFAKMSVPDQRSLLHKVARLFAGERLSQKEMIEPLRRWMQENQTDHYNKNGTVSRSFVGTLIKKAAKMGLLKVKPLREEELADQISTRLGRCKAKIVVAPDRSELLRYAWADLVGFLVEKLGDPSSQEPIICGVSGGKTMLDLASSPRDASDIKWDKKVNEVQRKRVLICSLTSGGIRSDIGALSDSVAAIMAERLGVNAHGLLGPAWFADKNALAAFQAEESVKKHLEYVEHAHIIVTSVGYLGDPKALLTQLLAEEKVSQFLDGRPDLADLLYNCYDGWSGESPLLPPEIADHFFSVIDLESLHQHVAASKPCFVLASGKEKGRHALRGLLLKQLASCVYMDHNCGNGLYERLGD